ncbi:MAG: MmcQ/YjbR family DNA-binding protein [Ignavibacteriae bacterium]|nr:MmcQ/YjbR family DNA-binding protein [Ignavibacteriota bacterium]
MELEKLREYCLNKNGSKEDFPFDEETLVFKVGSKMFCLVSMETPLKINLKCEPEDVINLIEENEEIMPGYHMNKKYWITINLDGKLSNKFVFNLIDNSYKLVYEKLPKKEKEIIEKSFR